eukprot:TRINITY_DN207_c0_g1_i13.p1 TRINITY_DN207_c0_g1~~TRINITY_DN207_c0_g1_i13.p1  ORF type:complete len:556 (-),score=87.70 TRINITY_DN207_c0_g1_i13:1678-3345(-)
MELPKYFRFAVVNTGNDGTRLSPTNKKIYKANGWTIVGERLRSVFTQVFNLGPDAPVALVTFESPCVDDIPDLDLRFYDKIQSGKIYLFFNKEFFNASEHKVESVISEDRCAFFILRWKNGVIYKILAAQHGRTIAESGKRISWKKFDDICELICQYYGCEIEDLIKLIDANWSGIGSVISGNFSHVVTKERKTDLIICNCPMEILKPLTFGTDVLHLIEQAALLVTEKDNNASIALPSSVSTPCQDPLKLEESLWDTFNKYEAEKFLAQLHILNSEAIEAIATKAKEELPSFIQEADTVKQAKLARHRESNRKWTEKQDAIPGGRENRLARARKATKIWTEKQDAIPGGRENRLARHRESNRKWTEKQDAIPGGRGCSCQSGCNSSKCKCHKNGNSCHERCGCIGCQNKIESTTGISSTDLSELVNPSNSPFSAASSDKSNPPNVYKQSISVSGSQQQAHQQSRLIGTPNTKIVRKRTRSQFEQQQQQQPQYPMVMIPMQPQWQMRMQPQYPMVMIPMQPQWQMRMQPQCQPQWSMVMIPIRGWKFTAIQNNVV